MTAEDRLLLTRTDVVLKARRVVAAWRSEGEAIGPALQDLSVAVDRLHDVLESNRKETKLKEVRA